MKTIITIKTGKGGNSTEREIDKTVDEVVKIAEGIKGEWKGCRCMCDGTSLVVEK